MSAAASGNPGQPNGPVFTEDFSLWQYAAFSAADLTEPSRSGPLADPDGDGFNNLTEFGLSSDPLNSSSIPEISYQASGPHIEFTVRRPRRTSGITWNIESSADLGQWSQALPAVEIISQTDTRQTVILRVPNTGPRRQFRRIGVTLTPLP